MNLQAFTDQAQRFVRANAPAILTGVGVAGCFTTAALAVKGAFKAKDLLDDYEDENAPIANGRTPKQVFVRKAQITWRCYLPAAGAAALTVMAVIGSNRMSIQRTAAAATAYSLTERAFSEYKKQVVATIGENKEKVVRDEIAAREVLETAPDPGSVEITGKGMTLCREAYTGRYFMSDQEAIRKAENDVNSKINHDLYVTLEEFYDCLDIDHTSHSNRVGWTFEYGLLDISFSPVLTADGRPCLSFAYNYVGPV